MRRGKGVWAYSKQGAWLWLVIIFGVIIIIYPLRNVVRRLFISSYVAPPSECGELMLSVIVHLRRPLPCLTPHISWTPVNICITLISLETTFPGLHFRRWQYGSICIRLAVVASQTREITRNSERIRPYSSSRSSKVIDLGVNWKPMCNFLLVINSNFSRIWYRFRDIDA